MTYPLQAARDLRAREVDDAKAALAVRRQEEAEAATSVQSRQQALSRHDERIATTRQELRALGIADAQELQRQQAYQSRLRQERKDLVARREEAQAALVAATKKAALAVDELAAARAEQEAVERHFERWQREQKRAQERKVEAEMDDQVSARFGRE